MAEKTLKAFFKEKRYKKSTGTIYRIKENGW